MDDRLEAFFHELSAAEMLDGKQRQRALRHAEWLADAPPAAWAPFLRRAAELPNLSSPEAAPLLAEALARLAARRKGCGDLPAPLAAELRTALQLVYLVIGGGSPAAGPLLAVLARGSREDLVLFTQLLVSDPPEHERAVLQALGPLLSAEALPADALFPQLWELLDHPALGAVVLDLANHLARRAAAARPKGADAAASAAAAPSRHPAAGLEERLCNYLGAVAQTLQRLEENPAEYSDSPQQLAQRVAASVSFAVALCDALALVGDSRAIPKLHQALEIRHRRLRTEAAAALARLGEKHGVEVLLDLASEPVARLRVLAYAEELGLADQVAAEFRSSVAVAEAELAVWLAEPTQFGVPPAQLELVDRRHLRWPGFSETVECFLFRFTYRVARAEGAWSYSNVGIAGPLAHAFTADLADLPPDDIYAAFAGWAAEHEEIRQFDVSALSQWERTEVDRLSRRLHDAGYREIAPQQLGFFFGEKALLALASREGAPGVAIADFREILFFPSDRAQRALGLPEAYSIYKGRKLLRAFNP